MSKDTKRSSMTIADSGGGVGGCSAWDPDRGQLGDARAVFRGNIPKLGGGKIG